MGIGLVLTGVFGIAFFVIYGLMRLSCYLKKKYCQAEGRLCELLELVMCESCKESCRNHRKLLLRAVLFSVVVVVIFAIGYWCRVG